jgi:BirA family biotin operon repressor/biotin-[acetyl-CoA-carboxylase] ligase
MQAPKIEYFKSLDSTNQKLKDMVAEHSIAEFTAVVADYQTAGRGHQGTRWESTEGMNLTFSFLIKPHFIDINDQFIITQLITLSILDVLKPFGDEFRIKWPNDIYSGDKKLAGILIENNLKGRQISSSIIGIGLNLNQVNFSADVPNPISLCQISGKTHDRDKVMKDILNSFIKRYSEFATIQDTIQLFDEYYSNLYRNRGLHSYRDENGVFKASFHSVKPDGHLILRLPDGSLREYAFKEVEFVI